MKSLAYYTSEQFIWDNLIDSQELAIEAIYKRWKRKESIADFAIAWL